MERLTKWNESSYKHAYYPRCFKEPCYGSGCKIKDCPFEIAVCERLAAYEDTGLTPKEVTALGELFDYALKESKTLTEQLTLLKHIRKLAEADKDVTAAQLYFYQWQAAFNQLTQAISHIKDEDKAGKLCAAIRAQLAAWGKAMEGTT